MATPIAVEAGCCFEGVDHEAVAGAGGNHGGLLGTRAARRDIFHLLMKEKLASGGGQGREAVNGVPGPRCSVGVGLLPCLELEVMRGFEGWEQAFKWPHGMFSTLCVTKVCQISLFTKCNEVLLTE